LSEGLDGDLFYDGPDAERMQQILARVAEFAATRPEFAATWEQNLTRGADQACADIAGRRLAGEKQGATGLAEMSVPVPDEGFDPAEVFAAFGYALLTEVRRRLAGMSQGGGFG
jgi:hypothetical protein